MGDSSDNYQGMTMRTFRRGTAEQQIMAIIAHQACKRLRKEAPKGGARPSVADVRRVLRSLAEDMPFQRLPAAESG